VSAILKFKPDIVHCVEHTPCSTFCGSLAAFFHIPTVWSSHTNLDYYLPLYIHPLTASASVWVYQSLRRTFLNLADYNLTVSVDFAKLLNENGTHRPVHVWKTGVDSELFNPAYRSEAMRMRMFNGHYSPEKILLVSVGRLSPEKHFGFLLRILERFPNAFLCIVGGGPYKDCLEPLFPRNQAYFMGFLQGEELASAYASADFFVYASVSETFGQVYLEAMSSGTPVVAAKGILILTNCSYFIVLTLIKVQNFYIDFNIPKN
jgi:sulfoquinovosyltransferase